MSLIKSRFQPQFTLTLRCYLSLKRYIQFIKATFIVNIIDS